MGKIFFIETREGKILEGKELENFKIIESDILVLDSEIEELVKTEMDSGCHSDFEEDYESELDYYLSNAKLDSYIGYIQFNLDDRKISDSLASEIQKEVIYRINKKFN